MHQEIVMRVRSARGGLFKSRDFNIFWAGQSLSGLGDAFGFLALPLLVLQATGSVAQMGLVTGTYGAGQLVAGIFSGVIVDRVDRRRLMILCDLGRMVLYGTIPLAWWLAGPQLWLIYVVAGVGSCLGNTFQVANITAVANLVDRDKITEANGRLQLSYALMFLIGPMLAGFVSQTFGPAIAIGVDAISFLASAISLLFIRLRKASADRPEPSRSGIAGLRDELLAGVRFLFSHPVLRWLTILLAGFGFLGAAGLDLFIFHLKHDMGQDDSAIGILFAVSAVGSIVGALSGPLIRRRWGFGAGWLASAFVQSVALAALGPAPNVVIIGVAMMAFTMSQTISGIFSMSFRQEITPDHLLGRVTSAFWMLMTAPGPLGAAAATALAEHAGAPLVLVLMGLGGILLATIGLFTPIRTQSARIHVPTPLPVQDDEPATNVA
jgi:MFS family permease